MSSSAQWMAVDDNRSLEWCPNLDLDHPDGIFPRSHGVYAGEAIELENTFGKKFKANE